MQTTQNSQTHDQLYLQLKIQWTSKGVSSSNTQTCNMVNSKNCAFKNLLQPCFSQNYKETNTTHKIFIVTIKSPLTPYITSYSPFLLSFSNILIFNKNSHSPNFLPFFIYRTNKTRDTYKQPFRSQQTKLKHAIPKSI